MNNRTKVPNRRMSEIVEFFHAGFLCSGQVSWLLRKDNEGNLVKDRPIEVFLDTGKAGTAVQAVARDTAVAVSIALQYGAPISILRAALTRDDSGAAAGPLGALLDLVEEVS